MKAKWAQRWQVPVMTGASYRFWRHWDHWGGGIWFPWENDSQMWAWTFSNCALSCRDKQHSHLKLKKVYFSFILHIYHALADGLCSLCRREREREMEDHAVNNTDISLPLTTHWTEPVTWLWQISGIRRYNLIKCLEWGKTGIIW